MKEKWDDKVILNNIRAGKQSGLTEFFTECGGRLVNFFKWKFRLSHEDAEEALQETLIRFVNSVRNGKFRGDASICTFLSKIGVNECLRILKAKDKYKDVLIDGVPVEKIKDSSNLEKELYYRLCVAEGLKEFEKADKNATERLKALTLQIFEGLSIKEIAVILSRTEGATKQFLRDTKIKLRPYLEECWKNAINLQNLWRVK